MEENTTTKAAIVGSRIFKDYQAVEGVMAYVQACGYTVDHIISGGAKGADTLAEKYAKEHKLPITIHRPDWDHYGKAAGFLRNKLIISECDLCVAFWDGQSHGTKNDLRLCVDMEKPLFLYNFVTQKLSYQVKPMYNF